MRHSGLFAIVAWLTLAPAFGQSIVTDRIQGVSTGLAVKAPVKAATTAAITLSGLQTVDGVVLATGDRVLVKDQSTASANGIYQANTSSWARALDFAGNRDVAKGTSVFVTNGTTNAATYWRVSTANPITIGTTSITWEAATFGTASSLAYIQTGTGAVTQTVQDGFRNRAVTIIEYGGVCDGVTNDAAALSAAAATARTVIIPKASGACVIGTNTTLAATAELHFEMGGQLSVTGGVTLTVNTPIRAPPTQQIFAGTGSIKVRKATVYADWFPGTDIGAKLNNVLLAFTGGGDTGPGVVKVSCATHSFSTQINWTGAEAIRLTSDCGWVPRNFGAATLLYTASGTTPALLLTSATYVEIDHIRFQYSSATFTGNFIDLDSSATIPLVDASYIHFHHCGFGGESTAVDNAARLVNLGTTYAITFEKCVFDFAAIGIGASSSSNSVITVRDSYFENLTTTALQVNSGAWTITGNVHQNDAAAAAKTFITVSGTVSGMFISGNLLGVDAGAGAGTLIDLSGGVASGASIIGNQFTGAGSTTAIRLSTTAGNSSGISITGNHFSGLDTGVVLGRGDGITLSGNHFAVSTPWNGTEPTNYRASNNRMGGVATAGVPVANAGVIALTAPGDADDGFGRVDIVVTVGGVAAYYQASYYLNGAGATVSEITDPAGVFTPTVGTADRINVYWETDRYKLQNLIRSTSTADAITVITNFSGR